MKNVDARIKEIIVEYFSGNLNEERKEELLNWVEESEEHEHFFKKYIQELYAIKVAGEWDSIRVHESRNRVFDDIRRFRSLRWFGVAAAVVVLLFSSVFLFVYKDSKDSFVEKKIISELMIQHQDRHQAVLSIGENKKMILHNSMRETIYSDSNSHVFMDDSCTVHYEKVDRKEVKEVARHTLEVPNGSEFRVTLSDGTQVWMNAGSKLSYPEYFEGGTREVFLEGEAYFEVVHNAEMPFVVKTADMGITVLGTSFNVKGYPDDEEVITTLATGKIEQSYVTTGERIILTPSEQAIYNKSNGLLKRVRVDVNEVIGWKDGRVIMKNKPLKEIFKELARWYDFEVEYKNERLKDTRFYLNMDRYDDIKMVLEKLQKTNGIKFIFYGRKIMVYDDTVII